MIVSQTEAGQILDKESPAVPQAEAPKDQPSSQKEEQVSSKLAVLMERERQALNRERMAKSQEEKLTNSLKMIEEYESLKRDPNKVDDLLKNLGWDYDRLTQSKLQDGQVPPSVEIQRLKGELDQLRDQLKQEKTLEVENQRKRTNEAEQKAVGDFKSEINDYLKNNSQRYELIDFESAQELVFDIIDEHYNRTIDQATGVGKVLPIAEAADKVEKYLEEKYIAAKDKNKVKAFWANVPKNIQEQLKKQDVSQPPKTLTNNMGPKAQTKSTRLPEDKRVQAIVEEQMAKMRSQFAG